MDLQEQLRGDEGGCLSSITSLSILDQTKTDMKVIRLVAVLRNICHYKLDLVSFAQRSTQSSSGHLEASGGRPELHPAFDGKGD